MLSSLGTQKIRGSQYWILLFAAARRLAQTSTSLTQCSRIYHEEGLKCVEYAVLEVLGYARSYWDSLYQPWSLQKWLQWCYGSDILPTFKDTPCIKTRLTTPEYLRKIRPIFLSDQDLEFWRKCAGYVEWNKHQRLLKEGKIQMLVASHDVYRVSCPLPQSDLTYSYSRRHTALHAKISLPRLS